MCIHRLPEGFVVSPPQAASVGKEFPFTIFRLLVGCFASKAFLRLPLTVRYWVVEVLIALLFLLRRPLLPSPRSEWYLLF